jgi:TonB family protein
MRGFRAALLIASLIGCGAAPTFALSGAASQEAVKTGFAILVGFPSNAQASGGSTLLVPGTVIPLTEGSAGPTESSRRQVVEKSLSFSRAAEKLWSTFRLDPARQRQEGRSEQAVVGKPVELPALEDANVKMTATLLHYDNATATYRVIFKQGEKILADSTVPVARGGRAVVGGMDGAAAPYIFVFIEPEPPGAGAAGAGQSAKTAGITEPVLVYKVAPQYPEEAKKEKVQGIVVLDVVIDADGGILEVTALEDPDSRLTQAAISAVKQWKFRPALDIKGKPVRVHSAISLRFQLR